MEKTEIMIEYEIKIDSIVNWESNPIGYTRYLESELIKARAKAESYDRLMSGGKKTPKEVANFLDLPIAQDKEGFWHAFGSTPVVSDGLRGEWNSFLGYKQQIPSCNIRYSGDWKDSLTLPDGLEEK